MLLMASRKRSRNDRGSLFSSRSTERIVDKAVDGGIALGVLYAGVGALGAITGAFKK